MASWVDTNWRYSFSTAMPRWRHGWWASSDFGLGDGSNHHSSKKTNVWQDHITIKVSYFDGKWHLVTYQGWIPWRPAITFSRMLSILCNVAAVPGLSSIHWIGIKCVWLDCHQLPYIIFALWFLDCVYSTRKGPCHNRVEAPPKM